MSDTIKAKFKITKKVFQNNDFFIFGASPIPPFPDSLKLNQYFCITLKGELSYLSEGKEYELEVEELSTDKYGTSYRVVSAPSINMEELEHLTRERSQEILEEITTSSQANYVLDAYENFIWLALTKGKEAFDLSKIYNVGECRLNAYIRELNTKYKYLNIMNRLKEWKLDISDCRKLIEEYLDEEHIAKEIQSNPYKVLISTLGRSFEFADRMIMELRPDLKVSEMRCAYLILSVLKKNEAMEGDTLLDANALYNYILEEYTQAKDLEPLIVPVVTNNDLFYYNEKNKTVSIMATYMAECKIADFIVNKYKNSTKLDIDYTKYTKIKDGELTEEQQNILKTFCESNITIVNAKGGTGKSATTLALINMLEDNNMTYSLLTPTGRVAKALKILTNGRPTSTIHKACLSNPFGIWSDVFIIEEGSMIGIDLMCMLINAIANENARIIINMDLGQIAPISCGCPMRDIINSGIIPICNLTKVFRYGEGGLYKMATDAYDKKFYIDELDYNKDRVSIGENNDYTYVRYNGEVQQVVDEYKRFLNRGIKPIDIAVITCWNVTDFGTINLNNEIQKIVNPDIQEGKFIKKIIRKKEVFFKVNDIILNCQNTYEILTLSGYNEIKNSGNALTVEDVETTSVMNGEIGRILDIDDDNIIAQFDEDIIVFDKKLQDNLLLAYSLTSYKLQGSECPYVITLVTPQFEKSLNKNIIYTDMSRARKEVVEIIDPTTLANAITIDSIQERLTNLERLLRERTKGEGINED